MTAVGLWAPGLLVSERYQIESYLDQGGAGEVYAARNVWTDRPVALKRLQPKHLSDSTIVERFLLEGRVGGRIEHPNVVQTFDMGRDPSDGSLFIVQELLRGMGMREMLLDSPKLGFSDTMDLMLPVMGAVHAVHQQGIVHRDIKPENIFIAEGPLGHRVPKLLDFGIAKVRLQETLTQRGTVLGTLDYMAPEQILGEGDIDRRADIWALGVVTYELLFGKPPFDAGHVGITLNRILTQDPRPLCEVAPDVPKDIGALVMSALNKDRQSRPRSVQEMLETILHWAVGNADREGHRLINRHRGSIPAFLEAKLSDGSSPNPLGCTWSGLRHAPPSSTRLPLEITQPAPPSNADDPRKDETHLVRPEGPPASTRALDSYVEEEDEDDQTVVGAPPVDLEQEWLAYQANAAHRLDKSDDEPQPVASEVDARLADGEMVASVRADGESPSVRAGADSRSADVEIEVTVEEEAPLSSQSATWALEAHQALATNDYAGAIAAGDRAIGRLVGHPEAQASVRLVQAAATFWLGDFAAQQRFGVDAYYLTVPGTEAWLDAIGEIATASGLLGEHERLWDLMAAIRSSQGGDLLSAELIASCRLAIALHRAGWPEHVETVLSQLGRETYDRAQSNATARGWLCMLRGELAEHAGDPMRNLRMLEEALAAFVSAGDHRWACMVGSDLGYAWMGLGDYKRARELLEQSLGEAEALGIYGAANARLRLGAVHARLGNHDEGLALARAALERSEGAGDWNLASQAHMVLSSILTTQGSAKTAEIHARSAVESASPSTRARANALGNLSLVLSARPIEALLAAVQAMEMLQSVGGATDGEARIRLGHALALSAMGHETPAKQAIESACQRLTARAANIDDEAVRVRFLGVKEHTATLELARCKNVTVELVAT
jgi:serine/threonine protein kinase/tetratricopeptide (TPR) repeat protein